MEHLCEMVPDECKRCAKNRHECREMPLENREREGTADRKFGANFFDSAVCKLSVIVALSGTKSKHLVKNYASLTKCFELNAANPDESRSGCTAVRPRITCGLFDIGCFFAGAVDAVALVNPLHFNM